MDYGVGRYTLIQRLLHWLVAMAVIGALGVGTLLEYLGDGAFKNQLYALHKATGMAILGLMILRLALRIVLGVPPLPVELPSWQRTAAAASHFMLYALILSMPILGWAATSAYPAPIPFFGLLDVPPLIGADRALSEQLFAVHAIMGKIILGIVLIHIGAALHHGLSRRDGVLRRMWF